MRFSLARSMAERVDPAAVRATLADPRDVARALGLEEGARREGAGGLVVRCPVHGDRTPSLSLQIRGGTLSARCWACGWGGDLLALVAAVERLDVRRDFGEVLKRAAELAGGGAVATCKPSLQVHREEAPRLPDDVAAELFGRICEAGRLGSRGAVERYLDGRGLLDAARADGWASLPSLNRMLDIAREVWQQWRRLGLDGTSSVNPQGCNLGTQGVPTRGDSSDGPTAVGLNRVVDAAKPSGQVSGGFAFCEGSTGITPTGPSAFSSPEDLLVAARLAFWGRDGELVTLWGRHRLVIPWRGPDGRIQALQRRLVDAPRKMRDGREEPRYVLTWAPRWPYGVERLDGDAGAWQGTYVARGVRPAGSAGPVAASASTMCGVRNEGLPASAGGPSAFPPVVFVEGAIDALAARLLLKRPAVVLGLPGTGGWVSSWAGLVGGRKVFWGLDGDAAADERAAKGAIDVAEAQGRLGAAEAREARRVLGERLGALAAIGGDVERGRITAEIADARRAALGPARCALCGVEAAHLCAACGRVRPRGKDWGEAWERCYASTSNR
jgi:hypothetical protein